MSRYRTLLMQRLTVAILLFTALFSQVQVLYACASMTGKPSHVCCCGKHTGHDCAMQDTCTMLDHDREEGCCQLDYDLLTDHVMSNAASTVDMLTLLLDSPQPPISRIPSDAGHLLAAVFHALPAHPTFPASRRRQTDLSRHPAPAPVTTSPVNHLTTIRRCRSA